eukprot:gene7478-7542_t
MKEIKAIISAYDQLDKSQVRAALATVVRVEGSSYRRTGARMLVMDNGVWVGGISGGCLEGDALKRARLAIAKSQSSLVTYDTTDDDAYQIGVGLGCNGIIDVLFMPLDFEDKNNPVEVLKSCAAANRQLHVLITITGIEGEWSAIRAGDDQEVQTQLQEQIARQTEAEKSGPFKIDLPDGKKLSVFIEILLPEIHLVLMGHQYDIYPLAKLVREVGWRATMVSNPLKYTAIVLMSHDYKTDKRNLPLVLETRAFYIGMLGPRVRSEKIFGELTNEGVVISDQNMERIYAPAGLDIGAISPEEIASSIIVEARSYS